MSLPVFGPMFFLSVSLSGGGFCRGEHCQEGGVYQEREPRTIDKRAVCILLECFLITTVLDYYNHQRFGGFLPLYALSPTRDVFSGSLVSSADILTTGMKDFSFSKITNFELQ